MVRNTQFIGVVTIDFFINCSTKLGQTVYVSGNCPELGNWTPQQGVKLQTNRKIYPQWVTSHPLIIKYMFYQCQFKICVVKDDCVSWQNVPQNHYFFTGIKPTQIYLNYNSMYMEMFQKKFIQIECRNGTQNIMNDMESEWGSSVGHPSNYPLERFHMTKRGELGLNQSQISSNLISVSDSEQIDFQQRILNALNPANLIKTMSKPCEISLNYSQKKQKYQARGKMNSIPQGSEGGNDSTERRSYRSLPKDYNKKQKNTIQQHITSSRKSFPRVSQEQIRQGKEENLSKNTQTLNSQRRIDSEKETVIASWISDQSKQNQQKEDIEVQMDQLFGFEFF